MSRIFFILSLLIVLATSQALAGTEAEEEQHKPSPIAADDHLSAEGSPTLERMSRVLAGYKPRAPMTCDRFPRICQAKESPGPDCCKKICVNVMIDNLNCGRCGSRCRYGEACCGGKCVSVMYDPKHCGGCRNKCKKGSFCRYGMCSYA